jgi:hypothetical protein
MNKDLIRQWLELPAGTWPPDHYTLLALTPREADSVLIERRTQERMMRVRPYQLNHPDEATEALNRLASAFNCLTDPAAKQTYDASIAAAAPQSSLSPGERGEGKGIDPADPLAWLFGPWSQLTADQSRNGPTVASSAAKGPASSQCGGRIPAVDQQDGFYYRLIRMLKSNRSTMRVRRIWLWILQHPGLSLMIVGILAFLVALIRHWRR